MDLRLAWHHSGRRTLMDLRMACASSRAINAIDSMPDFAPALLVSFAFLDNFEKAKEDILFRNWVMDSGAFSAHNSGVKIDLVAYVETCKRLLNEDKKLVEVFALDVIGDHKASLRNAEKMWENGVPAIPTYHAGSPESALDYMAKTFPKIALGGVALARGRFKEEFARQCFARVWPKKIHGFGYGGERHIMEFPWHSVDATNWETGPSRFGQWRTYGKMSIRGSKQNLRAEVEYYLRIEKRANIKWKTQMKELDGEQ